MSRKNKKNSRRNRGKAKKKQAAIQQNPAVLLEQVNNLRKNGQAVRAREGAQRLYSIDSEAHEELFQQLTIEAAQVESQAGNHQNVLLFIEQGPKDLSWETSDELILIRNRALLESSDRNEKVAAATWLFSKTESCEAEAIIHAADCLVVEQSPEAELVTIAISQLCAGQWQELESQLRNISRQSPFAHWRLFLAGFSAWYQGQFDQAAKVLSRLPQQSVTAKKARGILALTTKVEKPETDKKLAATGDFFAQPNLFAQLAKADQAIDSERFYQAYKALAEVKAFPCFKPSLSGILTGAYLNRIPYALEEINIDDLCHRASDQLFASRAKHSTTLALFWSTIMARHVGLNIPLDTRGEFDEMGRKIWGIYHDSFGKQYHSSARFKAMCLYIRGLNLEQFGGDPYEFYCNDEDEVAACLEKAIKIDKSFEKPYHDLLDIYQDDNNTSKANKLLDTMIKQFPDSPQIAAKAAKGCFQRKVYTKALRYYETALLADPLNTELRSRIAECHMIIAFEKAAKNDARGVKKKLSELSDYLIEDDVSMLDNPFILNRRSYFGIIADQLLKVVKGGEPNFDYEAPSQFVETWLRRMVDSNVYYRNKKNKIRGLDPTLPKQSKKHAPSIEECLDVLKIIANLEWVKLSEDFFNRSIKLAIARIKLATHKDLPTLQSLALLFLNSGHMDMYKSLNKALLSRLKKIDKQNIHIIFYEFSLSPSRDLALKVSRAIEDRAAEIQAIPKLHDIATQLRPTLANLERARTMFSHLYDEVEEASNEPIETFEQEIEQPDIAPEVKPRFQQPDKPKRRTPQTTESDLVQQEFNFFDN